MEVKSTWKSYLQLNEILVGEWRDIYKFLGFELGTPYPGIQTTETQTNKLSISWQKLFWTKSYGHMTHGLHLENRK